MKWKSNRIVKVIVWGWIGIVLSISAAMIWTTATEYQVSSDPTKDFSPDFYRGVEIIEVPYTELMQSQQQENENTYWSFDNPYSKKECFCFIFKVNGLDADIQVLLEGLNKKEKVIFQQSEMLQNGWNIFTITVPKAKVIKLSVPAGEGEGICLSAAKFSDGIPRSNKKKLAFEAIIFMGIYSVLSLLIVWMWRGKKKRRRVFHDFVEWLQGLFQFVGRHGEKWLLRFGKRKIRIIRIGLLVCMFAGVFAFESTGGYAVEKTYHYMLLLCCIVLIWVGILCWEKELRCIRWSGCLAKAYFAFILLAAVSEMFVRKKYCVVEYVLLFAVTFFVYMWQNMSNPRKMLMDMLLSMAAVAIVEVIIIIIASEEGVLAQNIEEIGLGWCDNFPNQLQVWKKYIEKINLFGHSGELEYWGETQNTYNVLLEILYRYGIIGMIPYSIMYVAFGVGIIKMVVTRSRNNIPTELKIFVAIFGTGIWLLGLVSNLEYPFQSMLWIIMYCCIGWLFEKEKSGIKNKRT